MPGVVETTDTFVANQVITSTLMNNIIDQTQFTNFALANGTLALTAGQMKVATGGITSNELAANAVTATAIAADAVTNNKINNSAVNTDKILNGSVTSIKIADGAIINEKIADAAITAPKLNGAQTGSAPIFGCRAWVSFDATKNAAGGTDAALTNRFIRASGNVSSVMKAANGVFVITFTTVMPSANYQVSGSASGNPTHPVFSIGPLFGVTQTTSQLIICTGMPGGNGSAGFLENSNNANVSVFG